MMVEQQRSEHTTHLFDTQSALLYGKVDPSAGPSYIQIVRGFPLSMAMAILVFLWQSIIFSRQLLLDIPVNFCFVVSYGLLQ